MNKAFKKHSAHWASFGAAILLFSLVVVCNAIAGGRADQVCDVGADYSLGVEDYPEAIRLHSEVVREHPENALAHYHLGFAQGMAGNRAAEVREYERAAALGLANWDLFLNLGLAHLEDGELEAAAANLQRAVHLGENHPESHFNLALVDERRGMRAEAEQETLASLALNSRQPDARNLLAVIYVQEGKTVRASEIWHEIVREVPDYELARTNLILLGSQSQVALGETAATTLPAASIRYERLPKDLDPELYEDLKKAADHEQELLFRNSRLLE
jgi:Flp pilus assembly protein TadD